MFRNGIEIEWINERDCREMFKLQKVFRARCKQMEGGGGIIIARASNDSINQSTAPLRMCHRGLEDLKQFKVMLSLSFFPPPQIESNRIDWMHQHLPTLILLNYPRLIQFPPPTNQWRFLFFSFFFFCSYYQLLILECIRAASYIIFDYLTFLLPIQLPCLCFPPALGDTTLKKKRKSLNDSTYISSAVRVIL